MKKEDFTQMIEAIEAAGGLIGSANINEFWQANSIERTEQNEALLREALIEKGYMDAFGNWI